MKKIQTYLVHGSLGSGKTTLIRNLLNYCKFKDALIIENEYANINIDKNLLQTPKTRIVDISGGCVCCTSQAQLAEALGKISKKREIKNLIIETTGIASSVSVIKQLILSNNGSRFRLVKNILIVDALEESVKTLKKQKMLDMMISDLIVINKTDLISDKKYNQFVDLFEKLGLNFIRSNYGKIDPRKIWSNKNSISIIKLKEHLSKTPISSKNHSNYIFYQAIYPKKRISIEDFKKSLIKNGSNILRIKGYFTNNKGDKILVNSTPKNFEFSKADKKNKNVIVIIGKKLTRDKIKNIEKELC